MNHSWWLLPDFSLKRSRKFQADERLFSLSSVTSPAVLIVVLNVAEHHMLSGCPFSYCFQIMEFANFDPFSFSFAYRLMNIWLDEMVSFLCAPFLVEFKSAVAKETHADFQYSSYPCRWKRIWTRPFKRRKHPCKWAVSFRYNFWTLQSLERPSEQVCLNCCDCQALIPCVFWQRETEEGRTPRWVRRQETTAVQRSRSGRWRWLLTPPGCRPTVAD